MAGLALRNGPGCVLPTTAPHRYRYRPGDQPTADCGLDHGVGHPSCLCTTPQNFSIGAKSMQGLRRDAEGSQRAETVREAHDLPRGFRMVRSDERIHFLGCFHIGEIAYCVWALPPTFSRRVQRGVPACSSAMTKGRNVERSGNICLPGSTDKKRANGAMSIGLLGYFGRFYIVRYNVSRVIN